MSATIPPRKDAKETRKPGKEEEKGERQRGKKRTGNRALFLSWFPGFLREFFPVAPERAGGLFGVVLSLN